MEGKEIEMKQLPILIATVLLLGAEPVRYDHKVRDMYFAAFSGDKGALAKAMVITEATLKENPNHAEALVWHGAGVFFQSAEKFRTGDMQAGMELMWLEVGDLPGFTGPAALTYGYLGAARV